MKEPAHQRHAAHGVRAHDGNGVGRHGREEEGDDAHDDQPHQGLPYVVHDATQGKESENGQQGDDDAEHDGFHGQVLFGAGDAVLGGRSLVGELVHRQANGALDDTERLDNADDAGRGDAADADMPCVPFEQLVGGQVKTERKVRQRDDDQPHQQAAAADDETVFQADDISQAQHGGTGVEFQHHLGFVGEGLAETDDRRGDGLAPGTEGGDDKVVQTAHQTGGEQGLGTGSAALAAHEHLCGGRGFGEGIFAVHLAHEIFPEGNQEQDAQHAAQQGRQEHLPEIYLYT